MKLHEDTRSYTKIHDVTQSCMNLHNAAQICTTLHNTALHKAAQSCARLLKAAQSCTKLHKAEKSCTTLHKAAQSCTKLHKTAQICTKLGDYSKSFKNNITLNINIDFCSQDKNFRVQHKYMTCFLLFDADHEHFFYLLMSCFRCLKIIWCAFKNNSCACGCQGVY